MASALAVDESTPFTHAGRTALQKILAVLREIDAEGTQELAARVRLFDDGDGDPGSMGAVERAIVERRVVEIDYVDKHGQSTARTVEPVAVLGVKPHWYLWGFCRLRQEPRAFRIDRIGAATVLDEQVQDRGLDPAVVELPSLIGRGILGEMSRPSLET